MESQVREIDNRDRIEETLEERLRFERLLSDVSARFVNIAPDRLDEEIEHALRSVMEFFQVDRCGLLRTLPGKSSWLITHVACSQDVPPVPTGIELPRSINPWAYDTLIEKREPICFAKPEDTPAEAEVDRATWKEWGIRSNLVIPVVTGDAVDHLIAINSVKSERALPSELIPRLRLLGEIFVNALERRRAEQALQVSEQRLSLAASSADIRLWEVDIGTGLIWVTEKGRDFYGLVPGEQMTLDRFLRRVHSDDRELIRESIEKGSAGEDINIEYRVEASPEDMRWISSRGRLSVDPSGKKRSIMGVSVDITERKAMEARIRESEERLSLATASAEAGIWVMNVATGSVWATEKLRDLFRFAPDEALSMERFLEAIHPEDRGRVQKLVRRSIERRELLVIEYRILHPDGSVRWIVSRGRLDPGSPGRPDRLMGVSNDVTERREMEERLREQYQEIERLKLQLEKENVILREDVREGQGMGKIIGSSDALNYVLFRVGQVAPTDATVLILGETGTGKGMVANAIHGLSSRKDRPMITVNCAALPANLIESELFGREKGAFTGAHARQAGRFEAADGGTIFLDEIGELPLELQSKLLRVLQDGEFERLGSAKTVKVDVRVIASTSRDLREEVRAGRFREDLFYRLNVFPVTLPPLRKRADDIPQLVRFFADKYSRRIGRRIETIPKAAMKALGAYHWPGNVRELEHVIERAVITTEGPSLQLADHFEPLRDIGDAEESLKDLAAMEREHILRVLKETGWRIEGPKGAAAILQLHPSTLRFRIKKLGIRRP